MPDEKWNQRADGLLVPEGAATPSADSDPGASDVAGRVEQWATRVGAVAGSVAGLVIIVHLLGGIVMWLRFKKAGLPPDQAVAVMSREQMLIVGLRLMVLPTVATGLLAAALVRWQRRHAGREPRNIRRRRAVAELVAAGALLLVLLALVPVSGASATWLALVIVWLYWRRGFGVGKRPAGQLAPPWRLAVVAVLAAAVISLGRQIDEPVQLLEITVQLENPERKVSGVFVDADGDSIHIGTPRTHLIRSFRRSDVVTVSLGPPLERAPAPSALSRLLSDDRWAVTPPWIWCNGERYSLLEVSKWCDTQPFVAIRRRSLDLGGIPVRIRCPKQADEECRGYVRLKTTATFGPRDLGRLALPRRVSMPREGVDGVPFAAAVGRTQEVCVPVNPDNRRLLWKGVPLGRGKPERPVPMTVTLSGDPESKSILAEQRFWVHATRPGTDPSLIVASGCSARLRARLARSPEPRPAPKRGAGPATERVRVTRVLDGDTLEVRAKSVVKLLRLVGIDAPETAKRGKDACGERQARDHLLRRLFSAPEDADGDRLTDQPGGRARRVILTRDPLTPDRDTSSRLLRSVTVVGTKRTLQESMLTAGWAIRRPDDAMRPRRRRQFERAADKAIESQRGVYASCGGEIDRLVPEE
jgi:endonuclease YncB( thermonuclease family)